MHCCSSQSPCVSLQSVRFLVCYTSLCWARFSAHWFSRSLIKSGNVTGFCLLVQQESLMKLFEVQTAGQKCIFSAMAQYYSSICKGALSEHQFVLMGWCEKCMLAFPSYSVFMSLSIWMMSWYILALLCNLTLLNCLGILQWHSQDICELKLQTELFPPLCSLWLFTLQLEKEKDLHAPFSAHVQAELLASPIMVLGA